MEPTDLTKDSPLGDWARINKANWNSRVPHHEQGYALHKFADPAHLSGVVRFDLPRLGDVAGLRGVHLQCHIGTDTTSLARLGAQMTGLDFCGPALEVARRLAADCAVQIDYVESDLYSAPQHLPSVAFDFVSTLERLPPRCHGAGRARRVVAARGHRPHADELHAASGEELT